MDQHAPTLPLAINMKKAFQTAYAQIHSKIKKKTQRTSSTSSGVKSLPQARQFLTDEEDLPTKIYGQSTYHNRKMS